MAPSNQDEQEATLAQIQQVLTQLAPQQWKFTETLPTLTKNNFDAWECTLINVLREHELLALVSDTFDISSYVGTERSTMDKACASCSRMMSTSLHPDIFQLLPGSVFRETPNTILNTLRTLIKKDNALMHSILKAEAKASKMQDGDKIETYVEQHMAIRAKMISAGYPDITNEQTAIRFMIDGLAQHPLFGPYVGGWYCYGLPQSVDELHQRLHACQEHLKKQDPTPNLPASGGFNSPTDQQRSPHNRGRRPYRRGGRQSPRSGRGRWGQSSSITRDINKIDQFIENIGEQKPARRQPNNRPRRPAKANTANTTDDGGETEDTALNAIVAGLKHGRDERTYTLDSAAHPSHVNHPVSDMYTLKHKLTSLTATSTTRSATHKGTVNLKSETGVNISLPAIVNPSIRNNLVSAQELCKQYGHVLLSKHRGYILNTKRSTGSVVIATADWRSGQYQLNVQNVDPEPKAKSARTHVRQHSAPCRRKNQRPRQPIKPKPSAPPSTHDININAAPNSHTTPVRLPDSYPPATPHSAKTAAFHHWHLVFNHVDLKTIQTMAKEQLIPLPSY